MEMQQQRIIEQSPLELFLHDFTIGFVAAYNLLQLLWLPHT